MIGIKNMKMPKGCTECKLARLNISPEFNYPDKEDCEEYGIPKELEGKAFFVRDIYEIDEPEFVELICPFIYDWNRLDCTIVEDYIDCRHQECPLVELKENNNER